MKKKLARKINICSLNAAHTALRVAIDLSMWYREHQHTIIEANVQKTLLND